MFLSCEARWLPQGIYADVCELIVRIKLGFRQRGFGKSVPSLFVTIWVTIF